MGWDGGVGPVTLASSDSLTPFFEGNLGASTILDLSYQVYSVNHGKSCRTGTAAAAATFTNAHVPHSSPTGTVSIFTVTPLNA